MRSALSTKQGWIRDGARYYVASVGSEYVPCIEVGSRVSPIYLGATRYPTREAAERVILHVLQRQPRNDDKK